MMKHLFSKTVLFCGLFLFSFPSLFPQKVDFNSLVTSTTGAVVGSVIDLNEKPLEYTILYVVNASDSLVVANAISDNNGQFLISEVPFGKFLLKIESFGYKTIFSKPFTISSANPIAKFPRLKITQRLESLDAVEVKADKEMLQSNLDKKVFNVESSIIAEGTTAVEILEEIPSVDVNLDGNVTLRGSENVTILVDGRPTNLTLDQIPAEQIASIEVITNPSARLEPDGMAGILNIVLKKKREQGLNGMVTLGTGVSFLKTIPYFDKYNGNVNLNYHVGRVNLFLNYNFRTRGGHSMGDLERTSWPNDDTTKLVQENVSDSKGRGHSVQTGIDWNINDKNSISFTFGYNFFQHNSNSSLHYDNQFIKNGTINQMMFDQDASRLGGGNNFSGSLFYKKTFNMKGRELTADLFFSDMRNKGKTFQEQVFIPDTLRPPFLQKTNMLGSNMIGNGQIDFITPIGNGGRIETGYKFSYRWSVQDYSLFAGNSEETMIEDASQRNNFDYTEMINAAYFIYSNTLWEKLKYQVGIRGEIANTKGDLKSLDTIYKNQYYNLFPTLHLRYDINDVNSLQLSYSRRVSRPTRWQLNPFIDYSDRQNWSQGNPDLRPEFVNSVELGYLLSYKKTSLNVSLFYRQRTGIITRYTILLDSTTTMTTFENLNKGDNIGAEFSYGQRFWSFWRMTLMGSAYYEQMVSGSKLVIDKSLSSNFTWSFRLNNIFTLPKAWEFQVNFRYNAPSLTTGSMGWGTGGVGQGKRQSRYSLNLGVKKSFLNKNLVISLNARNVLYRKANIINTYSFENVNGFTAISTRYRDGFYIGLTVSYKFNNYKNRKPFEKGDNGNEEYPEMMDM